MTFPTVSNFYDKRVVSLKFLFLLKFGRSVSLPKHIVIASGLDLVLTNKEGLVGSVKLKGSLGCSDREVQDS